MSETQTHDYTAGRWGHDVVILTAHGMYVRASGWGTGIRDGHYLILPNGDRSTRYHVDSISYFADPPDMWTADLSFAPREDAS